MTEAEEEDCPDCDGWGYTDCPDCDGTGEVSCSDCNGSGKREKKESKK